MTTTIRAPFKLDSQPPRAKVLGPLNAFGDEITVHLDANDLGLSGLDHVELYVSKLGSSRWEYVGSQSGATSSLTFQPSSSGKYRLWVVPVDRAGNRGEEPLPVDAEDHFVMSVDPTPPGIDLVNFQDGGIFAGGSNHFLFVEWKGSDDSAGYVDLEFSHDNGLTWEPIGRLPLGKDRYLWTLPDADWPECRVRAVARELTGRRTVSQSRVPFAIDVSPPEVQITEVTSASNGATRIVFQPVEGPGADPARVWLYYTPDRGLNWLRWGDPFDPHQPIVVDLDPGHYGFVLRAEDEVGNVGSAPKSGGQAHVEKLVGGVGGVALALLNPHGGVMAGGSRHYVFWRLESAGVPFVDRPVRLEFRYRGEGAWKTIDSELPPQGRVAWRVPEQEGAELELRVVAEDLTGRIYESVSRKPILVDAQTPKILYVDPVASNSPFTHVKYKILDNEPIESVELWVRAVSTPKWRLAAVKKVGEDLRAEIPDGMYRVALVGVDEAGNRGEPPIGSDRGQADLLVDTVPPLLHVDGPSDRTRLFHEGEWVVLRPRVQDRHLSNFPVSFYFSDDGVDFKLIKEYHSNGDDYPVRLPEKAGVYHIEVVASDLANNTARQRFTVQVIPTAPTVTLLTNPEDAVLAGGDELYLEWESAGVAPLHEGLAIEISTDGESWITLEEGLPADGKHALRLPRVDSNRCRLRLTVTRPDGLSGRVESGFFTISSTVPRVQVRDVRPAPPDGEE